MISCVSTSGYLHVLGRPCAGALAARYKLRDSGITFLAQRLAPRQITLVSDIETNGKTRVRPVDLLKTPLIVWRESQMSPQLQPPSYATELQNSVHKVYLCMI